MKLLIVFCAAITAALARPGYLASGVAGIASAPLVAAAAPSAAIVAASAVLPAAVPVTYTGAVVAAPAAAVVAAPVAIAAPLTITSQHHAQDELGQFNYGYAGGPSAKEEIHTADGITRGEYSYIDANGLVQSTSYVSDPVNGFRVAATNLPVAPKAEDAIVLGAPQQVDEEPLVAATRAAHEALKAELAAAAAANPVVPEPVLDTVAEEAPISVKIAEAPVVLTAAGTPVDTPEVAAAKTADVIAHLEAKKVLLAV